MLQSFIEYLAEKVKRDTAVFNFGKFNIPTIGHTLLMNTILDIAKTHNADAYLFASQKMENDPLQTPLRFSEKVRMLKAIAPKGLTIVSKPGIETNTMFSAVSHLGKMGYKNIVMVVGSDRFKGEDAVPKDKLVGKLKAVNPNATLKFVMAGEQRKERGSGVAAASSSAAREAFTKNDKVKFASIVPKQIAKQLWTILKQRVK